MRFCYSTSRQNNKFRRLRGKSTAFKWCRHPNFHAHAETLFRHCPRALNYVAPGIFQQLLFHPLSLPPQSWLKNSAHDTERRRETLSLHLLFLLHKWPFHEVAEQTFFFTAIVTLTLGDKSLAGTLCLLSDPRTPTKLVPRKKKRIKNPEIKSDEPKTFLLRVLFEVLHRKKEHTRTVHSIGKTREELPHWKLRLCSILVKLLLGV